ncbi:hypothetical protein D3C76_912410 [compost metagenome]
MLLFVCTESSAEFMLNVPPAIPISPDAFRPLVLVVSSVLLDSDVCCVFVFPPCCPPNPPGPPISLLVLAGAFSLPPPAVILNSPSSISK